MSATSTALLERYYRLVDDPPADPSTGKGPEWGKASPVGLLIILLLAVATFFLLRSMTRRLKRVQDRAQQLPAAELISATTVSATETEPSDEGQLHQRTQRSDADPPPG